MDPSAKLYLDICLFNNTAKRCYKKSNLNNGYCDDHQEHKEDIYKFDTANEIIFTDDIKDALKHNILTPSKESVIAVYNVFCWNKKYFYKNKKLVNMALIKLKQCKKDKPHLNIKYEFFMKELFLHLKEDKNELDYNITIYI